MQKDTKVLKTVILQYFHKKKYAKATFEISECSTFGNDTVGVILCTRITTK
jgi:hypothetical protein